VPTVVFEELIIIVTYLLACNLVVQHVVSCNWVLPVGNIFIIIIIIIIIKKIISVNGKMNLKIGSLPVRRRLKHIAKFVTKI
jgi:hypothetical protein